MASKGPVHTPAKKNAFVPGVNGAAPVPAYISHVCFRLLIESLEFTKGLASI